jgi:L-amino acid N-acyltransferase YncA
MYKRMNLHVTQLRRCETLLHAARARRQPERAQGEPNQPRFSTPFTLRDGSSITIRTSQPEDRPALRALFERLSPQSLAQRFHSVGFRITDAVVDGATAGHALVAELEGRVVALASFYPHQDGNQAEVAIVVEDAHQGRGIGLALGACLSREAQRAGFQRLRAEVQGANRRTFKLLRSLEFPMTTTWAHGVVQVEIALPPSTAQSLHHERKTT